MTLNAMFRYPDLYKTGISVASVPDQRLYDTIYQERYMGLPDDNADGYRNGSPITFAKDLKGNLLIVHGTGDDNVHYQGFELLVNELVAHNKAVRHDVLSQPVARHLRGARDDAPPLLDVHEVPPREPAGGREVAVGGTAGSR